MRVRQAFPATTLVTSDVGSHKLLVGQVWKAYEPRSVLMTNGLSSMGFALPGADHRQAPAPRSSRRVLHRRWRPRHGASRSCSWRLSLKLGLVVVVFCDNSLNRIELKQIALKYPSWGTRFDPSDIAKLAEAMGCDGVRVDRTADLVAVLSRATALSRPLVVEVHIDPAQYQAQF